VLVVENEHDAGPERLRPWLTGAGIELELCRPYTGEKLPKRIDKGGLIVLGGEMGAADDHKAPWLAGVRTLFEQAVADARPVLGICLGAQLLASACGGRVEPSRSGGEVGLGVIDLNDRAGSDRLFGAMQSPVEAVQWHNDEITKLPEGAVPLASSSHCQIEAYRIAELSWGVQFHPEVDSSVLRTWAASEDAASPERRRQIESAIEQVASAESRLFQCWRAFAEQFAIIVKET
jgi:GMP synthase (glutamine-hydrolysing)